MNKSKKIIIGILIALIIVVGIVVAYKIIENSVTNRADFNFTVENISPSPVKTVDNQKDGKNYYKEIDNIKLELNIPNNWNYEEIPKNEENDFYKYALKLYKNNENQYAMLYFYNDPFGVCGTGRTSKNIILNNGKEATVGYYDGNKNWADISFYNTNAKDTYQVMPTLITPIFGYEDRENVIIDIPQGTSTYVQYSLVRENEFFVTSKQALTTLIEMKHRFLNTYPKEN